MAKVILRSNFVSGSIPDPSEIDVSELVLGGADGRLWTKNPAGQIVLLNAGVGGGGSGATPTSVSFAETANTASLLLGSIESASWAATASFFDGNATSASIAATATSASYASNADLLDNQDSTYYLDATNINAGPLDNAFLPAQIDQTGVSASFTGSLTGEVNSSGHLLPTQDSVFDLGSPSFKWRDLHLSGATFYLGDVALKSLDGDLVALVSGTEDIAIISASFTGSFSGDGASITNIQGSSVAGNVDTASYAITAAFAENGGGGGTIDGGGTTDYLTLWQDADTLTDSLISQSGTQIDVSGTLFVDQSVTASAINISGITELNSVQYTWPADSGLNQEVLTTDGAGGLTWSAKISGSVESASYAANADLLDNQDGSYYTDASNIDAGILDNAFLPAQIDQTGFSGSFTGSFIGDGTNVTGVISSSYSVTSSHAEVADTANSVAAADIAGTLSDGQLPVEIAYEDEANVFTQDQTITGSVLVSGNIDATGYDVTAATFSGDGSGVTGVVSSSYATTSSYAAVAENVNGSITSASYALTASYADNAGAGGIDGSGTTDYIPLWQDADTLTDSLISQSGTEIGITGSLNVAGGITGSGLDIQGDSQVGSLILTGSFLVSGNIDATGYDVTASAFSGDGSSITGVVSSSYALSSSHAEVADTANSVAAADIAGTLSDGQLPVEIAYEDEANVFTQDQTITGSLLISGGNIDASGYDITGSNLNISGITELNNVQYTWPADNGLNQEVLTTDGAGGLTWTTKVSGSVDSASYAANADLLDNQDSTYYLDATNINAGPLDNAFLPAQIDQTGFSGSFTGSFVGDGTNLTGIASATSASYALSSSHAEVADTANAVAAADVTGVLTDGQLPVEIAYEDEANVFTQDQTITGSLLISGGNIDATGYDVTASAFSGDGSGVTGVISSSYSVTASYADNAGGGTIDGSGTANYITMWQDADTLTDSIISQSGTEIEITGSLNVASSITGSSLSIQGDAVGTATLSGSLLVSGNIDATGYDVTASGLEISGNPDTGTMILTGSFYASGNIDVTGYDVTASAFSGDGSSITGVVSSSYATTSSYATIAENVNGSITSASYALTASYADNAGGGTIDGSGTTNYITMWQDADTLTDSLISQSGTEVKITGSLYVDGAITASQITSTDGASGTAELTGSLDISGSVTASDGFSGDGSGITGVISASYVVTASYAETGGDGAGSVSGTGTTDYIPIWTNSTTLADSLISQSGTEVKITGSLYVDGAITASQITSSPGSTGAAQLTGSLDVSGSVTASDGFSGDGSNITGVVSSSYALTSSYAAVAENVNGSITSASYALTASYADNAGGGTIDGSGTANYLTMWQDADTLTDSLISQSGTEIGITGSLNVAGSVTGSGIAIQNTNPNAVAQLSGSLDVSGSVTASNGFSGDGSGITGVISASYVVTASYAETGGDGAGSVSGTGTTDYIPIWTNSTTLANSLISQSGTEVKITGSLYVDGPVTASDILGGGSGPLEITGSVEITGSLNVVGSITGSGLDISGSGGLGTTTITGSVFVAGDIDATGYDITASGFSGDGSNVTGVVSSSYSVTSSYATTAETVNGSITSASYATTSSYAAVAENVNGSITSASYALTASYADNAGGGTIDGSGTGNFITMWQDADTLTDSIMSQSGQTIDLTGSINVLGAVTASEYTSVGGAGPIEVTGSMEITGTLEVIGALTASEFTSPDGGSGTAELTGSLDVSGSVSASSGFFGDGSSITGVISASYVVTASYAETGGDGAGSVSGTGTTDYIPIWTNSTTLADSLISQSGTEVEITGSLNVLTDVTASAFSGDGADVTGVVSSSYSVTASYAANAGGGTIDGSGTANYLTMWQDADTLTDSIVSQSGTTIEITGSLNVLTSLTASEFTSTATGDGILEITGSLDVSGSITASEGLLLASNNPGTARITGSLDISGSITTSEGMVINSSDTSGLVQISGSVDVSGSITSSDGYGGFVSYITIPINGLSGSGDPTGYQGSVQISNNSTLTAARMFSSGAGSIWMDIRTADYSTFQPLRTIGTSITGSTPFSMSNDSKYEDTTLTGWTTTLTGDNVLSFYVIEKTGDDLNYLTVTLKTVT